MNARSLLVVASYVRKTDPAMFAQIARHIGSRGLIQVGAYVQATDPDMFDQITRASV